MWAKDDLNLFFFCTQHLMKIILICDRKVLVNQIKLELHNLLRSSWTDVERKRFRNERTCITRRRRVREDQESRSVINTPRNIKFDWFLNKCLMVWAWPVPQISRLDSSVRFYSLLWCARRKSNKFLSTFLHLYDF